MIFVLINWRIKPDQTDSFLKKWKEELSLDGASGLIGEFLSKVEMEKPGLAVTWEMEPDAKDGALPIAEHISYVNIGIWNSFDDFQAAVGKYMSLGREIKEEFEAAPRRRAVVSPEHWRIGLEILPVQTSEGVNA